MATPRASVFLITMLTSAGLADGGKYTVSPTGALPDLDPYIPTPPGSSGNAINDLGHVAGGSIVSGGSLELYPGVVIAEPIIPHPFRSIDGVIEDLGIPGGDVPPDEYRKPTSIAWGINNQGWIVGEYVPVDDFLFHAFVWLPEPAGGLAAGFTELPWLSERGRAWSINDGGVVAGESRAPGELGIRAVYWTNDGAEWTVHDLGTFGGPSSAAYGVNAQGQITGFNSYDGGVSTTFLYLPTADYGLPAGMSDVTPQFTGDRGNAINDLGQIVGRGDVWAPMIWLPEAAYGLSAGATVFAFGDVADQDDLDLIGSIGLALAEFTAISSEGTAVGWGDFAVELPNGNIGFARHGLAWIDGEFTLVQRLFPEGSGWSRAVNVWGVNEAGQITGSGIDGDGNVVGFILTPVTCDADTNGDAVVDVLDLLQVIGDWGGCDEPCSGDVNGDGVVDVADLIEVLESWGACA